MYDPARRRLLLWYRCGWRGGPHHGVPGGRTCVATSRDGLRFERPKLATRFSPAPDRRALRPRSPKVVRPARGTNVVLATAHVEAFEVAYDFLRPPPRFVALRMEYMTGGRRYREYTPYVSADGLAWTTVRELTSASGRPGGIIYYSGRLDAARECLASSHEAS